VEAGVRHVNVLLYTNDLLSDVQQIGDEVAPRLRALQRQEYVPAPAPLMA
jgi:hypothetical protein